MSDKVVMGMVDGPDGKKIMDSVIDSAVKDSERTASDIIDRLRGKVDGVLDKIDALYAKLNGVDAASSGWGMPVVTTPIELIKKAAADQLYPPVEAFDWQKWRDESQAYERQLSDIKDRLLNAHAKRTAAEISLWPLVDAAIHRERYNKAKALIYADDPANMEMIAKNMLQSWDESLRELEKAADILAKEPNLKSFKHEDGTTDIQMEHWAVKNLLVSVKDSLGDAPNYRCLGFTLKDGSKSFNITIQRAEHETPETQQVRVFQLFEAIMKLVNEGKTISFSEDSGGNSLTVSINAKHTHVGVHNCTYMELIDQLHAQLVEGYGLSWHDDTKRWEHHGQSLLALKSQLQSIRDAVSTSEQQYVTIHKDYLSKAIIELVELESLICLVYLPGDRSDEPDSPDSPTEESPYSSGSESCPSSEGQDRTVQEEGASPDLQ